MLKALFHYFLILKSGLFDRGYYLLTNPDVRKADVNALWHFVRLGWKENRNPSSKFNISFYLDLNNDVKVSGINPFVHYIKHGKDEERKPIPLSRERKLESISLSNKIRNPELITIYIHIGQNKTGTTAIQKFLDLNRKILLSELGYLYPNFDEEDLVSGLCGNHTIWYRSVKNDDDKLFFDLNRIRSFCKNNKIHKVILSNEGWFLTPEVIRTFNTLIIKNFPFVIKPICYLRRIDHWVESAWKQWGLKQYDSLDQFADKPEHLMLFKRAYDHFKEWNKILEIEHIIIRPYEKHQLEKGLLSDFLSLLGIEYSKHEWTEIKNKAQASNSGYNRDVVELLHICRDLFSDVHDNNLFHLVNNLLGNEFQKKPFESYNLLSPQKSWDLYNHNLPYEKIIAQEFMGRKDGKIFYEPEPNPNDKWEPYMGLKLETALPIIIKMIETLQKR